MQVISWDKSKIKRLSFLTSQIYNKTLYRKVNRIVQDVYEKGDTAVRKYTKLFDNVTIPANKLRVTEGEINRAFGKISFKFVPFLKLITKNVRQYYECEKQESFRVKLEHGGFVGKKFNPIERVGVYIPGGQAPLVSTVYMTVLPAQVAGVKDIIIATPPNKETGYIDPHILVVANLLGVKEIYKIGGAQAIAAMAFGTKTMKKVDKIVGPGNEYVTEAKRQVYGFCDIDMVAGPSEVAILADSTANPDYITCDLLAQAEHTSGVGILITNSKRLIDQVAPRIDTGYVIHVKSIEEGIKVVNEIAPEHLELMIKDPELMMDQITHTGAIFIGDYSPAAVGDYFAGPSHVLPTGGTARFYSPLGVSDFLKSNQYINYSKEDLSNAREYICKITEIEGMLQHRLSVETRFQDKIEEKANQGT
ncbi:MAG: histidinol dehydrogenase [Candidatus Omnitrophica bacterium]|nr:histidinol dehydrogenase [Candidatus Omnitrophota bacterium]